MSSATSGNGLPPGVAADGPADAPAQAVSNPLLSLQGLVEALTTMDHAINQNNYLAQLLLYRCGRGVLCQG